MGRITSACESPRHGQAARVTCGARSSRRPSFGSAGDGPRSGCSNSRPDRRGPGAARRRHGRGGRRVKRGVRAGAAGGWRSWVRGRCGTCVPWGRALRCEEVVAMPERRFPNRGAPCGTFPPGARGVGLVPIGRYERSSRGRSDGSMANTSAGPSIRCPVACCARRSPLMAGRVRSIRRRRNRRSGTSARPRPGSARSVDAALHTALGHRGPDRRLRRRRGDHAAGAGPPPPRCADACESARAVLACAASDANCPGRGGCPVAWLAEDRARGLRPVVSRANLP